MWEAALGSSNISSTRIHSFLKYLSRTYSEPAVIQMPSLPTLTKYTIESGHEKIDRAHHSSLPVGGKSQERDTQNATQNFRPLFVFRSLEPLITSPLPDNIPKTLTCT